MKTISFLNYLVIVLIVCGCGYELKKKDDVTYTPPPKTTNSPKVVNKSNDMVISDFNNLMSWYKTEVNYDKSMTQVMVSGSYTYSVKFLHKWSTLEGNWGEKQGDDCQSCSGGYPCSGCGGDGRVDLIPYEKFRTATLSYELSTNNVTLTGLENINY